MDAGVGEFAGEPFEQGLVFQVREGGEQRREADDRSDYPGPPVANQAGQKSASVGEALAIKKYGSEEGFHTEYKHQEQDSTDGQRRSISVQGAFYTRTVDLEHFEQRLLQKEKELLADIQRLQTEAREPRENEVRDEMDEVTSSEARDTAFQESSLEFETLQQVRDALQRIEDGVFGKCIDCGREIQQARLEAVPWTPYCLEDQQKHDSDLGHE